MITRLPLHGVQNRSNTVRLHTERNSQRTNQWWAGRRIAVAGINLALAELISMPQDSVIQGAPARPLERSIDAEPVIPDTAFRDAIPQLPRGEEIFVRAFAALAWLYGLYWIIWRWT